MYSLSQGAKLIALARHSIETFLKKKSLNIKPYEEFTDKSGVFVTIKKDGRLRGEMGFLETADHLHMAVVKAARDAAFRDKRFPPLKEEEINEIEIEISITTKPVLMRASSPDDYIRQIDFGFDGLMIKAGVFSSIILPQSVGGEGWDAERMLRQLCISAGMTMDAWKSLNHQIFKFQAQVFAERNGKVVELA